MEETQKSGGSPRGVKDPPTFATRKIKNTTIKVLFFLYALALKKGLIMSIAAPVVPIQEAKMVPMSSMMTFTMGVPTKDPRSKIPPETVYRDHSKMINGT